MDYIDLFRRAAQHVESQGVRVEFLRGPALNDRAVEDARRVLSIPLPESMVEFYQEVGDGVFFRWIDGDEAFANLEFSQLVKLAADHEGQKRSHPIFDDNYDWPYADNPRRAKRTARRMRQWLGFHDEGNGDRFCLDTAVQPAAVVFDRHDWMASDNEDNRHPAAATLRSFMEGWGSVCFQFPSSLYWPSVLTDRGVDWDSNEFDPRFRLPRVS